MFIKFLSDAEKQLASEKESLENLRKQIGEAQKQSGKRKFEFARTGNPKLFRRNKSKFILRVENNSNPSWWNRK